MPDLPDLLARVEAAEGADRELDGRIMFALFAKPCGDRGFLWPEDNPSWSFAIRLNIDPFAARKKLDGETIAWKLDDSEWLLMNSLRVPALTASLDAALALCERVLPPETSFVLRKSTEGYWERKGIPAGRWGIILNDAFDGWTVAKTPALALLAALLKALIATGQHDTTGASTALGGTKHAE